MSQVDEWVGATLDGRYQIVERIGTGGMGAVYKARQTSVERLVAIKMLRADAATDAEWVARFYNEAHACSRLQHPNTIRMFDFGQTERGNLYMVMELLTGRDLRQVVDRDAPVAADRAVKILAQCAASLSEAHGAGIIHRDIKPDNVFLIDLPGSPEHVKVLDFSVAKLLQESYARTAAGLVFGTPQYMSPEQAGGKGVDHRSDLYALGVLGYELLTGAVPFDNDNPLVVLAMVRRDPVPRLPGSVPMRLAQILHRCLERDPAARPGSAAELGAELDDMRTLLRQSPRPRAPSMPQATLQGASGVATPARTLQGGSPGPVVTPVGRTLRRDPGDPTLLDDAPPDAVVAARAALEAASDPSRAVLDAASDPSRAAHPSGNASHRPGTASDPPDTVRDSSAPPPRALGAPARPARRRTRLLAETAPAPAPAGAPARPRQRPARTGALAFWSFSLVAAAAVALLSYAAVAALTH